MLKPRIAALFCSIFLLLVFNNGCGPVNPLDDPNNWVVIDQPEKGFYALFPRQFKEGEVKTIPQDTSEGTLMHYIYGQSGLAFYYSVYATKFPPSAVQSSDPEAATQTAVEDLIKEYRAKVIETYPVARNNFPGRYVKATLPKQELGLKNNNILRSMVFVRDHYLYRVTAVGIGNDKQVQIFFDSFQLKPF